MGVRQKRRRRLRSTSSRSANSTRERSEGTGENEVSTSLNFDSAARQAEIKRMQDDLRKLKKRAGDASDSDSNPDTRQKRRRAGRSYLEQELAKYSAGRGRAAARAGNRRGKRDEEDDLLKEMGRFSKKVALAEDEGVEETEEREETGQVDEEGVEVDDDIGWMRHRLKFIVDEKELTRRAEDEYSVSDPEAGDCASIDRSR